MNQYDVQELSRIWFDHIFPTLVDFQRAIEEHTKELKRFNDK